jgi:hypothetical protein
MEQRAKLAEQLKKKMPVGHRSTERIVKEEAYVWQVDETVLMIEFKSSEGNPERILVKDIEYVKQTDYPEDNSFRWVLGINHKDKEGKVTMLQFNKREDRDIWVSGLRSLVDGMRSSAPGQAPVVQTSAELPTVVLQAVADIALEPPLNGSMARVCLTLGKIGGEKVYLDIPEGKNVPQQLKSLVQDFVEQHSIMSSESTSLYRLLRTMMQRITVSRETQKIITEISSQRLDLLMPKGQSTEDPVKIQEKAEERLNFLKAEIPRRIGDQGTAAPIVSMILQRNIDKMLIINEMIVKAREKEPDVPQGAVLN